jgi:hypothetical protein
MHKPDYAVFLDLKDDNAQPEYYILPTLELDRELDEIFQCWLVANQNELNHTIQQIGC